MATNLGTKGRFHVGHLIVGDPISDGGANPNAGYIATATANAGAVTGVSAATSAVITFTNTHNLNVGQLVTVTSPSTFTGATNPFPGTYVITAINVASKTITLGGCSTSGATISGFTGVVVTLVVPQHTGAVTGAAVTAATGTSTVTITAAGNWVPGQKVVISGVNGITNVNGTQVVVTGGFGTFTFVPATAAASSYTSGGLVYDSPATAAIPRGPSPREVRGIYVFDSITLVPQAALTNSTTPATQSATFTVILPGVKLGDLVIPSVVDSALAGAAGAGLVYSAYVTAANTVVVVLANVSAATITAANASLAFSFVWVRLT